MGAEVPLFQELQNLPREEMHLRLTDPSVRAEMLGQAEALANDREGLQGRMFRMMYGRRSCKSLYPIPDEDGWDYEPMPDESVAAIAERQGQSVFEVAYDCMMSNDGKGVLWRGRDNVVDFYDDAKLNLLEDDSVPGISDAGAHLAIMQDGTAPTTMLAHWARDRTQGTGQIPIEICVQKQARDTAYIFNLHDRGTPLLRHIPTSAVPESALRTSWKADRLLCCWPTGTLEPGKKADMNMVDMAKISILHPEHVYDLPVGAPRWAQDVTGYDMTLVDGVPTFINVSSLRILLLLARTSLCPSCAWMAC